MESFPLWGEGVKLVISKMKFIHFSAVEGGCKVKDFRYEKTKSSFSQ